MTGIKSCAKLREPYITVITLTLGEHMIMSKILAAALVAIAIGARAQNEGMDLPVGSKTETDGNTFTTGNLSLENVKTFNANMDTNFTPPAGGGGGKPGNGKSGDGKPGDGKNGRTETNAPGGNKPGGSGGATTPATPAITLSGVTGTVQIKTAGGIMTVKAGEPIPVIPSGSEIVVVSGDVSVKAGGVTVKAGAGDSFTINTTGGSVGVAVTGGLVSVTGADGKSKDVAKGEGVTVASTPGPVVAKPVAVVKAEEPATPESIPAESETETTVVTAPASSPTQETTTASSSCSSTVSGSTPCP